VRAPLGALTRSYTRSAIRLVTAAAALEPAVTPVCTMLATCAPMNSACAITGRERLLALLVDGRLVLRLTFVFARLALRAAVERARVPAAFLAVVLRFVAAVRRLVVCVVAMSLGVSDAQKGKRVFVRPRAPHERCSSRRTFFPIGLRNPG